MRYGIDFPLVLCNLYEFSHAFANKVTLRSFGVWATGNTLKQRFLPRCAFFLASLLQFVDTAPGTQEEAVNICLSPMLQSQSGVAIWKQPTPIPLILTQIMLSDKALGIVAIRSSSQESAIPGDDWLTGHNIKLIISGGYATKSHNRTVT